MNGAYLARCLSGYICAEIGVGSPSPGEAALLREEENRRLMEVPPGTPMGDLMRRYWQPIAAAGELDETPIKPVRLLGEGPVFLQRCQWDGGFGTERPEGSSP